MLRSKSFEATSFLVQTLSKCIDRSGQRLTALKQLDAVESHPETDDHRRLLEKSLRGINCPPCVIPPYSSAFARFYTHLLEPINYDRFDVRSLAELYIQFSKAKIDLPSLYSSVEARVPSASQEMQPHSMSKLLNGASLIYRHLKSPQKLWLDRLVKEINQKPDLYLKDLRVYAAVVHCIGKFEYGALLVPEIVAKFPSIDAELLKSTPVDTKTLSVIYTSLIRLQLDFGFLKQEIFPRVVRHLDSFNSKHLINLLLFASEPKIYDAEFTDQLLTKLGSLPDQHNSALQEAKLKIKLLRARLI
jgi:hypothetical protein